MSHLYGTKFILLTVLKGDLTEVNVCIKYKTAMKDSILRTLKNRVMIKDCLNYSASTISLWEEGRVECLRIECNELTTQAVTMHEITSKLKRFKIELVLWKQSKEEYVES